MKRRTLRRWNNALHRDLGYLAFGLTIIYAISGIVLNHFKSGDFQHPDYGKKYEDLRVSLPANGIADRTYALSVLEKVGEADNYKSHVTGTGYVQIYITDGTLYVDLTDGSAQLEKKTPRYILKDFNLLHYNNIKSWFTWFSDLYAAVLIILAITGLFILRGRNGITGRGWWLTSIGIIIPIVIILIYG
jgi:uncharacterized protein